MTEAILTDGEGNTLRAGIDVGGIITPDPLMDPERNQRIFDDLQNVKFRSDDIMLCTFPKSGTNWMFELLSMINNKSAERIVTNKYPTMIECQSKEDMDNIPSPRVMNSHLLPSLLPKDLFSCKIKTILCLRNPKDVAVSFYHQMVGLSHYYYTGTFAAWLPLYLKGELEDGKYTDYLLDWERTIDEGLTFPLHIMYYEDLKLDTEKELNRLLEFLDIELSNTLKKDIIDACSFEKMAEEKLIVAKELYDKIFQKGYNFFRKALKDANKLYSICIEITVKNSTKYEGKIGDWKNLFTVAQNEMFEGIWNREMNDSKMFKFIYTDPSYNNGH